MLTSTSRSSAVQRRAAFAASDAIIAVLRRDDALAKPIGYSVTIARVAGVTQALPGDAPVEGSLHYGITGALHYFATADDGRTVTDSGGTVPFSIIVNAPGRLGDAEQLTTPLDRGPSVLSDLRETGKFREHPIYNGECVVVSGRPVPPFVSLTTERYYQLSILGARADSTRHASEQKEGAATQAAANAKANSSVEHAKREADNRKTYETIKQFDPKAAEQFLEGSRKAEADLQAQTQGSSARTSDSLVANLVRQAQVDAGKRIRDLQSTLRGLSPAERAAPASVTTRGGDLTWRADDLARADDPDSSPLVQLNPAFFDRSRSATAPQIITVCVPGLQGREDTSYDRLAGDERERERVMLERRTRDAVLIRDHLDWSALEALLKPELLLGDDDAFILDGCWRWRSCHFLTLRAQVVPPTGATVASKAQAVHLDASKVAKVTAGARTATFTAIADADLPPDAKSLESGAVVGSLTVTGDGTLPAGQYNVYLSKTTNGWEAALERGSKIVSTSRSVTIATYPPQQIPKPVIRASVATGEDDDQSPGTRQPVSAGRRPHSDAPSSDAFSGSLTIEVHGKGWKVTVTLSW